MIYKPTATRHHGGLCCFSIVIGWVAAPERFFVGFFAVEVGW
jgi:hypothetical protein